MANIPFLKCPFCGFQRQYDFREQVLLQTECSPELTPEVRAIPEFLTHFVVSATYRQLEHLIKVRAEQSYGPWPSGMTLLAFDDGYGWTVSISPPKSAQEDFYRSRTFGIVMLMFTEFELDLPRMVA
ncbi:hypothetical protein FNL56_21520 [Tardiphaga sp. vice304]|uniref:hypothetical protein n=1 Tax=Tardiphaga sp. vice304 TaxID=2592817 RepID=UPI0011650DC1|nr:hypothetical protein [Tardiphaga sp. vice304]QDM28403.1 hypothetical protein FNL56_21520 [Tardiphaga sp. vice304]